MGWSEDNERPKIHSYDLILDKCLIEISYNCVVQKHLLI